jgi:hypothetical protein
MLVEEFGREIPDRAWTPALTSIVARLGLEYDLVIAAPGAERLLARVPGVLRVWVIARDSYRTGSLMIDLQTDRGTAAARLAEKDAAERERRKARFGRVTPVMADFDLILNSAFFDVEHLAAIVETAAKVRGITEEGRLSPAAEAQIQFQARLQLARYGITPAGKVKLPRRAFGHPSEELFANLLDFYRIAWEYEPRSFPLQWDKDGKIIEAFTPDFYLPEFDLYVELTTMKQALVTKKNRKIKLLKAIYPHVNIQVFYQKDFQDLIFKHGLESRLVEMHEKH